MEITFELLAHILCCFALKLVIREYFTEARMNVIALEGCELVIVVLVDFCSMRVLWLDIVDEIVLLQSRSFHLSSSRKPATAPYTSGLLHLVLIRSQLCSLLFCVLPNGVLCGERYEAFGDELLLILLLFATKPFHVLVEALLEKSDIDRSVEVNQYFSHFLEAILKRCPETSIVQIDGVRLHEFLQLVVQSNTVHEPVGQWID